ncbi:hypothetical protein FEM48_Zijuj12G0032300 [Ziziphus jujuba var. spinosa]|uniref:Uncharacterized protein n=1 Tax=Ziziphus jujuba var. spinosa TaxID=714518 RepID=A0A978UAV8_ZIZJJ|nr:hypothetical protein FEM48_Zijuj12G0032300 [Ziziphus jujuba var. spinosa]
MGHTERKEEIHMALPILGFFLAKDIMTSHGSSITVATSPKSVNGPEPSTTSSSPKGQCLCSPTTHQGSFRCRFHRSKSTTWLKRSKSMPANNSVASLFPKSVEST